VRRPVIKHREQIVLFQLRQLLGSGRHPLAHFSNLGSFFDRNQTGAAARCAERRFPSVSERLYSRETYEGDGSQQHGCENSGSGASHPCVHNPPQLKSGRLKLKDRGLFI